MAEQEAARAEKEVAFAKALEASQQSLKAFLLKRERTTHAEVVQEFLKSASYQLLLAEEPGACQIQAFDACLTQLKRDEFLKEDVTLDLKCLDAHIDEDGDPYHETRTFEEC